MQTTGSNYVQALNTMKQCTQYNSKINLEFIDWKKIPSMAVEL